jgi:cytochrome c553
MKTRNLLLALCLATAAPAMAASGDASVGKKKSTPCAVCHGADGVSPSPEFPNLAGQYADYLESAIRHYQNGKRKNPIMQAQVKDLKAKDIADLAAFFASQHGLQTKY